MGKSLVAFDTEHIKQYVFGTDKLREIRGASSQLDYLNRIVMTSKENDQIFPFQIIQVYANGGGGLFVVDSDDKDAADTFGRYLQHQYRERTGGGASITFAVQHLPEEIRITEGGDDMEHLADDPRIALHLELLRWKLHEQKLTPQQSVVSLPSHPFMRPCSACGIFYAEPDYPFQPDPDVAFDQEEEDIRDVAETDERYCLSCQVKRNRDRTVKLLIRKIIRDRKRMEKHEYLWDELLYRLRDIGYDLPRNAKRPQDFNVFEQFKQGKDYLGFIYADGNGMGKRFADCQGLKEYSQLAVTVDRAIYTAVCRAIRDHLKIEDHLKPQNKDKGPVLPFDLLLLGGDDVLMVVPASVALDVAKTIAQEFHNEMRNAFPDEPKKQATLSVGVVLAPIKYPFGLLYDLVEDTLKFAKKGGAKARAEVDQSEQYDDTRINFMTVTGNTSQSFKKVYDSLHRRDQKSKEEFYATLRPYDPKSLALLLDLIREGHDQRLGRTKLHQVREAVLEMNLTTSVMDGQALLRNWRDRQRAYILKQVYTFGGTYQVPHFNPKVPSSLFYRVTFPWFADGASTYRTPLLDFVELFDFVAGKDGQDDVQK